MPEGPQYPDSASEHPDSTPASGPPDSARAAGGRPHRGFGPFTGSIGLQRARPSVPGASPNQISGSGRQSRPVLHTRPIQQVQSATQSFATEQPVAGRSGGPGEAGPVAPIRRTSTTSEMFPDGPASSTAPSPSASAAGRPPGPPYRGFREPSPVGPRPVTLIAAALAVLIVLGGVVFGVHRLTLGQPGSSVASTSSGLTAGASQPDGQTGALATPEPVSSSEKSKAADNAPQTGAEKNVKLGVFLGTSPSEMRQFGNWLGREPQYAVDFSQRSTWDDIANPHYMIGAWRGTPYRMVYSVALLPWGGGATVKAGARGDYDEYYRQLARNLVAGGQEDAILRLGWEFNLKGWRWSTKNPDDFIGYWRHIVKAMRSVSGQKLEFDWNPNIGDTPYEAHLYYPGDKYVDYVGVDVYDVSWDEETYPYGDGCNAKCRLFRQEAVWDRLLNGTYGLNYWSDFARTKGKPMSIPEWGMWERSDGHGGGDDAYFVKQMHAFIDDPHNRVAYQAYLQVDGKDGKHKLTTLSKGGAAYKRLFK